MPDLRDRIDIASVTTTLLPLPKGKKRGSAVGFCAGEPVASVEGAGRTGLPFRWVNGKPEPITFPDVKKFRANGTSESQIAGAWITPKDDERAVVWTRNAEGAFIGAELHPQQWEKSTGMGCGDGQQVGFGYEKFGGKPSRALLWMGTRDSMVALTGPDPSRDAMGMGVAQGIQVGYVSGSRQHRACLWHGTTESYLDLHPSSSSIIGSEALGVGDGQQVGQIWDDALMNRAALWSGSADSYTNLSPKGFVRSLASACARGVQVGWACREEAGMMLRAILWSGTDHDFIDLQDFLPAPWNASWGVHLDLDGDRLRVLGTAQQVVLQNGYEVDVGKVPVIWAVKLRVGEPRRVRPPVPIFLAAAAPELSTEKRVEKAAADFSRAVIKGDFKSAYSLLAPWLQKQVTVKKLQTKFKKEFFDDCAPADFDISANDSQLGELREHYHEYHGDDAAPRTLATATEFGAWGPPSISIADEVTADNFQQWMSIDFTPGEGDTSGLDYCLRLWVIVVELRGTMKIGHLEPGE